MKGGRFQDPLIHAALLCLAALTLLPFAFAVNNVFRTNREFYQSYFSTPEAFQGVAAVIGRYATGNEGPVTVTDELGESSEVSRNQALDHYTAMVKRGPTLAWEVLRPYMLNSLFVSILTAVGVCCLGSSTAYILARYRFMGSHTIFMVFLATMMVPGVLTLVPSFLLVKQLGLLNTYWAMILPYMAGGQVFAIFVFKSFFEGLPEDLFESARMDGAGHLGIYINLVLPLAKPAFSIVIIMNVLGTWNNFLWPFITNTDGSHHVIASGLYVMANSADAKNHATMFAAYAISSIPLLVLFIYATKPFIRGITQGALKA
jgi:ABC-type glycerol-3-phosphate transport system permease component